MKMIFAVVANGGKAMMIKCEICEAISEQNKFPINNICPVCLHTGCLVIVKKPTKEQLRMLEELRRKAMRPIDADALDIMEYREEFPNGAEDRGWNAAVRMINDYIQRAPTLDYKDLVPQGEWVNNADDYPECNRCGYMPVYDPAIDDIAYSNFCPECGVRMKGVD